jgi:hypothetical protein
MKSIRASFLVLFVGAALSPWHAALLAQEKSAAAVLWEYQVLSKQKVIDLGQKDLAAGLNQLGRDGWELAAIDGDYIFKRSKNQRPLTAQEIRERIGLAKADVEMWRERASWSERMAQRGFVTRAQADADRARLRSAETSLQNAEKELPILRKENK